MPHQVILLAGDGIAAVHLPHVHVLLHDLAVNAAVPLFADGLGGEDPQAPTVKDHELVLVSDGGHIEDGCEAIVDVITVR